MPRCLHSLVLLTLVLLPALAVPQDNAPAKDGLQELTPFLDPQTVAVAHLDLRKVDVTAAMEYFLKEVPADVLPAAARAAAVKKAVDLRQRILDTGISQGYVIVSLADVPTSEAFAVFPAGKQAKVDAFRELLAELGHRTSAEMIHGALVVSHAETLERVRKNRGVERPDLAKALAAAGDAALRLAVSPSDDTRRGLRESLPPLPPELGGQSGQEVADAFSWLAIGVNPPPKLSLHVTLKAKDARAAGQLRAIAASGLDLLVKDERVQREFPPIKELAAHMLPKVAGDSLVLKIDEQQGNLTKIIDDVLRPAVANARAAAQRAASTNNLRQFMIALHTHHDTFLKFPARASFDKEGKELLSWRVHLLPFLEQKELYDQFHLDEPWDSEHNKTLIEKMPTIFAAPGLPHEVVAKGMTTYVVPVGPKTVFEGTDGISMNKIVDGTSNTIAMVEIGADRAVVWTKPDDWKVDFSKALAGLRGKPAEGKPMKPAGFNAALCDGSVRFISDAIDPEMLRRLLQKDDGEPVGEF